MAVADKIPDPLDSFWTTMEEIWAGQRACGHVPLSKAEIAFHALALRSIWHQNYFVTVIATSPSQGSERSLASFSTEKCPIA